MTELFRSTSVRSQSLTIIGLTTPPANTVTDGPDSSTTITPAATDSNTASITDNSTDSVSALTATTAITDDGTDSMSASTTTTTSDGSSNSMIESVNILNFPLLYA